MLAPLLPVRDPAGWVSLPGWALREPSLAESPLWLPLLMDGRGLPALPAGDGRDGDGKLLDWAPLEGLGRLDDELLEELDELDELEEGDGMDGEDWLLELDDDGMLGMDAELEDCWLLDSQPNSARVSPPSKTHLEYALVFMIASPCCLLAAWPAA